MEDIIIKGTQVITKNLLQNWASVYLPLVKEVLSQWKLAILMFDPDNAQFAVEGVNNINQTTDKWLKIAVFNNIPQNTPPNIENKIIKYYLNER